MRLPSNRRGSGVSATVVIRGRVHRGKSGPDSLILVIGALTDSGLDAFLEDWRATGQSIL